MYHFEGCIAPHDGYYISRNVSHTAMITIIEGRIDRRDGCMDRYVPHGSRIERQRVTSPDLCDIFSSPCLRLLVEKEIIDGVKEMVRDYEYMTKADDGVGID
uniref:Uncharacterized protein n=1 Tax=Solanum tuberosum TaxID=4113 RepID=M1DI11_SOLTU